MTLRQQLPVLLLFLLPYWGWAQDFRYKAPVGPVAQSGYHRLELSPDVVGRLQDGLGDLRLYDGQKREVPYLLARQSGIDKTAFVPFQRVSQTSIPRVMTTIVVRRSGTQPIESIGVEMKNTKVEKKATLSGSNDGTTWYALDDGIRLGRNENAATTVSQQLINFPLSDYVYFRLTVNDSTSAPLNILRIGSYGQTSAAVQYTPISGLGFTQHDSSDRHSYVLLRRASPARLDRLGIRVSSPAQYRRPVALGRITSELVARKRRRRAVRRQSFEPLVTFTLSSVGDTAIRLPGLLTDNLYLRIDNGDNPPLQLQALEAAQLTTYLTANLQSGVPYELQFGDPAVAAPAYDLAYFRNKLPATLPLTSVGRITDTRERQTTNQQTQRNYLIWGATVGVLLLLGTMSYRLLRETAHQQNADQP